MSDETKLTRRDEGTMERLRDECRVRPPVDIYENKDGLVLFADIPGVPSDGLSIELANDELTIEARRTMASDKEAGDCWVYSRSFQLPGGIDGTKVSAALKDGVLEVHLPKQEALKPRQIQVKAG